MSVLADAIVMTVSPSRKADGRRAHCGRGPLFDGTVDGRLIVTRSTQPLLDGARVLLGEGIDPASRIVMRHAGSATDALRSTVGHAARLSVADDGLGKPIFHPWQPRQMAENPSPVKPPMRQTDQAGTTPTLPGTESLAGATADTGKPTERQTGGSLHNRSKSSRVSTSLIQKPRVSEGRNAAKRGWKGPNASPLVLTPQDAQRRPQNGPSRTPHADPSTSPEAA